MTFDRIMRYYETLPLKNKAGVYSTCRERYTMQNTLQNEPGILFKTLPFSRKGF